MRVVFVIEADEFCRPPAQRRRSDVREMSAVPPDGARVLWSLEDDAATAIPVGSYVVVSTTYELLRFDGMLATVYLAAVEKPNVSPAR